MGTRQQRSDEELAGFSEEHLRYEVEMLHGTAQALRDPPRDQDGTIGAIIEYALLESFLIHARVLISFLYDGPKSNDVAAEHFFDENKEWTEHRPDKSRLLTETQKRINKELAHLTKGRLGVRPEIKHWEYWEIENEIGGILAQFCTLVPESRLSAKFRSFVSECRANQIDGRRASETLKFGTAGPTSAAFVTEEVSRSRPKGQ